MATATIAVDRPWSGDTPVDLPRRAKLLYAGGSLGSQALAQSRAAWLLYYYAPPPAGGLQPLPPLGLIGLLLAILQVVGAVDDALGGRGSTSSRRH